MKWVEKNRKSNLTIWIALLLIIAALSIWLCSIIEIIGNEVTLANQAVVEEEFWLYEGALQLWKSAYVIVILTATGILIASGMVTILVPQPRTLIKKVKLKDRHTFFEENFTSSDDKLMEEPTVDIKTLKQS